MAANITILELFVAQLKSLTNLKLYLEENLGFLQAFGPAHIYKF